MLTLPNTELAEVLSEATILDNRSHIEVRMFGRRAGILTNYVRAEFSRRFDRPVLFVTENGRCRDWWANGLNHNPGGPANVREWNAGYDEFWTDANGVIHAVDRPASISEKFGSLYSESWYEHGVPKRLRNLPAETKIVYAPGPKPTWTEFCRLNVLPVSGFAPPEALVEHIVEIEEWFSPRSDGGFSKAIARGIAKIREIDSYMTVTVKTFCKETEYRFGHNLDVSSDDLHRSDGPARIVAKHLHSLEQNDQPVVTSVQSAEQFWFYHNMEIPTSEVINWCKKKGIHLYQGYPIDRPAFVSETDAELFSSDFLRRR